MFGNVRLKAVQRCSFPRKFPLETCTQNRYNTHIALSKKFTQTLTKTDVLINKPQLCFSIHIEKTQHKNVFRTGWFIIFIHVISVGMIYITYIYAHTKNVTCSVTQFEVINWLAFSWPFVSSLMLAWKSIRVADEVRRHGAHVTSL